MRDKHAQCMNNLEAASYEGLEKARAALWALLEQNPDKWVVLLGEHCEYAYRGKDGNPTAWPELLSYKASRGPYRPPRQLAMQVRDLDPCVWCLEPTFFGSGRYVNRLPSGIEAECGQPREGVACAACTAVECGNCDEMIPLDDDYRHPLQNTDPQPDGFHHYDGYWHYECLKALGFTDKQIEKGQEL